MSFASALVQDCTFEETALDFQPAVAYVEKS